MILHPTRFCLSQLFLFRIIDANVGTTLHNMMQPHVCSNIVQCCISQSFSYCNKKNGLRGPLMTWCHPLPKHILGAKGPCTCGLRPIVLSVFDLGRRPKICKEHCHILFVAGKHNLQPYLRQKLVLLASAGRINLGRGGSGEHSTINNTQ